MINFSWAQIVGSKIQVSRKGHEVLDEENSRRDGSGRRNGKEGCKKITAVAETAAGF